MKYYQITAIFASVLAITTIVILSLLAKEFVLFNNYISDLGISEYAMIFNAALVVSGILIAPLAAHLYKKDRHLALLLLATGTALAGVGIFSETSGLHMTVSAMFFIFSFITAMYFGIKNKTNFGKLSVALSILGFLGLAFFNPLIETVEVFAIAAWIIIFAVRQK
ncbi:MAG: DUF998 domain-containing protein [Nanoarchaeota archaeon]|jgi:hypothetical membrane protein